MHIGHEPVTTVRLLCPVDAVDEIKILNPGDTDCKVNQVMLRAEGEKANRNLGAKKQAAEFEAHCDYL